MDFFQSQESLTALEWVLRAVIAFVFLVIVARVLGQRAISQLRLLDFVLALVIGNIIAHPLSDEGLGLKGSMITTAVLVTLYMIGIYAILKFPWFRRLVTNSPITVIRNGCIVYTGLRKARISMDILLEELREQKIKSITHVALATWEADGKLSIFLDPKYEPVTPSSFQMVTEAFDLPRTIIKEGKVLKKELEELQKEEYWVLNELRNQCQAELKDVLLATIDGKDQLQVFYYR